MHPDQQTNKSTLSHKISSAAILLLILGIGLIFVPPIVTPIAWGNSPALTNTGILMLILGVLLSLVTPLIGRPKARVSAETRIWFWLSIILLFVVPIVGLLISLNNPAMDGSNGVIWFMLVMFISPVGWAAMAIFLLGLILQRSGFSIIDQGKAKRLINMSQLLIMVASGFIGGLFFYFVTRPAQHESD